MFINHESVLDFKGHHDLTDKEIIDDIIINGYLFLSNGTFVSIIENELVLEEQYN